MEFNYELFDELLDAVRRDIHADQAAAMDELSIMQDCEIHDQIRRIAIRRIADHFRQLCDEWCYDAPRAVQQFMDGR